MDGLHSSLPLGIPLVVKASCDDRMKRIRFAPDLTNLQFCDFQERVAKALQFENLDFKITWEDDDGEHCDIASTDDLQEALFYFCPSEMDPSTQSWNMRVNVRIDAKVSLSDYGSSVWGESDEEGTVASLSSRSAKSIKSSIRSMTYSNVSNGNKASSSGRSYTTPPSFKQFVDSKSVDGSDGKKSSACPSGWGAANCSRWFGKVSSATSSRSGDDKSSYVDSLQSLNMRDSRPNRNREDDISEAESEASAHTRGPTARRSRKQSSALSDQVSSLHNGVTCRSCHTSPISGIRYHCASCPGGADFCSDCEGSGYTIKSDSGHERSHIVLRLAEPLDSSKAIDTLTASLVQAQNRLTQLRRSTCTHNPPVQPTASDASVNKLTIYANQAIKCSFCVAPILQGPRYLCANCPLVTPLSTDGFNLCPSCQTHSLQCHDPSHFFIKISRIALTTDSPNRIPLGERWDVQEATKGGPILPPLYAIVERRDPLQPPMSRSNSNLSLRTGDGLSLVDESAQGQTTSFDRAALTSPTRSTGSEARRRVHDMEMTPLQESPSRYLVPLDRLVHPSILCDNCFSVINGVWYRCCHCTSSFDLCETCEGKIAHDPSHSFAVFKQPVDLDLFKSCVDHQDAGEGLLGASRPMLSFPLL